jgi:acyl dehydratase
MAKQLYYEDVEVGSDIPSIVRHPTTRQLVMWAGASGDYNEIHYDKDVALAQNMPGVIIHGWLTASFLGQLLTGWIGDEGTLKNFNVAFRGMLFPGQDVICKGKVAKKYAQNKENLVECEIWAENPKGEKTAPATAVVSLPSKA